MKDELINSRRNFVKTLILSGVALQVPWIQSCSRSEQDIAIPDSLDPLSKTSFLNLHVVMDILFPDDGNGPGAKQLKSDHYFLWTVNDPLLDPKTRSFLLKKLEKLSEESLRLQGDHFHMLSRSTQEDFIAELSETHWSKGWLSFLLTLILETLFVDPQYDVNPDSIGWKWLNHNPGYPRPTTEQLYPTILTKKHEV